MNVYDFDKTIFYPDSSTCFVLYCLRKQPSVVLTAVPRMTLCVVEKLLGLCRTKELKQAVFSFLPRVKNLDGLITGFWQENRSRIGEWYLVQKRPDDVVISASPEFLLTPVAKELGFRLIGTRMDPKTGRIEGDNCHDEEKVVRFRECFGEAEIDSFYSDSDSDLPLAKLANHAYKLKRHAICNWDVRK